MPEIMEVQGEEIGHVHAHADWPALECLMAREAAIGKALAPVMPLIAAGVPVPSGNLAELQRCMIEAGYIGPEGSPIK